MPVNLLRSQRPALRLSLARATFRESASISAIVCSAVETVFPPGVFMTTIPWRVAVGTSMLSTPTPARTITFSRGWSRSTSAVSCVPERITIPSASASAARSPAGSSFVETTTSSPGSARSSSSPSSASLSVTRTRWATVKGSPRSMPSIRESIPKNVASRGRRPLNDAPPRSCPGRPAARRSRPSRARRLARGR